MSTLGKFVVGSRIQSAAFWKPFCMAPPLPLPFTHWSMTQPAMLRMSVGLMIIGSFSGAPPPDVAKTISQVPMESFKRKTTSGTMRGRLDIYSPCETVSGRRFGSSSLK